MAPPNKYQISSLSYGKVGQNDCAISGSEMPYHLVRARLFHMNFHMYFLVAFH